MIKARKTKKCLDGEKTNQTFSSKDNNRTIPKQRLSCFFWVDTENNNDNRNKSRNLFCCCCWSDLVLLYKKRYNCCCFSYFAIVVFSWGEPERQNEKSGAWMSFLFLLFLSKIANKSQMCSEQLNAQRERESRCTI